MKNSNYCLEPVEGRAQRRVEYDIEISLYDEDPIHILIIASMLKGEEEGGGGRGRS